MISGQTGFEKAGEANRIDEVGELPKVVIRAQTPEEELNTVQNTLEQMAWFKKRQYDVRLPDNPELSKPFSDDERSSKLKVLMEDWRPEVYESGAEILQKNREKIEAVFPTFEQLRASWGFKVFPEYEIVLTRYGVNGSYDAETGKITARLDDNGTITTETRPKPYHSPVHEMVHVGIEEPIVEKYQLTHQEKEIVVDQMVVTLFSDLLPDYKVQGFRNQSIAQFVNAETISDLPAAIARYVTDHPR